MTDKKHYINTWARPTVEAHMKELKAQTAAWGSWSETYNRHQRGALVQPGDEVFDAYRSEGGLLCPMTDIIVSDITVENAGHYTDLDIDSDAYHMYAKQGAEPIRFDVAVSPAQMKTLRYINAKGDLVPFAIDKHGYLTNQALRTSIIEIPEWVAEVLRGYLRLPRLVAA